MCVHLRRQRERETDMYHQKSATNADCQDCWVVENEYLEKIKQTKKSNKESAVIQRFINHFLFVRRLIEQKSLHDSL